MKQSYNYQFNPPEPGDEQIRSHMDFDALLKQVEHPKIEKVAKVAPLKVAKRFSLRPYIGAAVAATLVGVVMLSQFNTGNNNYDTLADKHFNQQPYINPPYEAALPQFASHKMNAEQGAAFSNFNIPPSAFLDEAGNPISGDVNIKYRNFNDVGQYFASGIPMQYDSLDKTYTLDAKHLFEIRAEKNGKKVTLDPEKGVQISFSIKEMAMLDAKSADNVGIYQLMENNKNWSYRGESTSSFTSVNRPKDATALEIQLNREHNEKIDALRQAKSSRIAAMGAQKQTTSVPQKPIKFDPNKITFDLDFNFDPSDVNAQYEGLKWQPKGDEKALKMVAATEWYEDEITLKKASKNLYKLHFDKDGIHVELDAIPVLSGAEFQAATAEYEAKLAEINANKNNSAADNAAAIQALEEQFAADVAVAENALAEKLAALDHSQNSTAQLVERTVKHIFTIHELGIWSCDRIAPEGTIKAKVNCADASGEKLENTTLFLADKNRNSLTKYYLGEYAEININPKSDNQIWIVKEDGKIAVAYPADLKKLDFKNKEINILLKTIDQAVKSERDVYKILKLGRPM